MATTPIYQIPYEVDADTPRTYPAASLDLATRLETLFGSWTDPVMAAGWVQLADYKVRYRVIAGTVQLSGSGYYAGGIPVLAPVMTLPPALAPVTIGTHAYAAGLLASASATGSGGWTGQVVHLDVRLGTTIVAHPTAFNAAHNVLRLDGVWWRIAS